MEPSSRNQQCDSRDNIRMDQCRERAIEKVEYQNEKGDKVQKSVCQVHHHQFLGRKAAGQDVSQMFPNWTEDVPNI